MTDAKPIVKRGRPFGTIKGRHMMHRDGKSTPEYSKWMSMHNRCYQKSHPAYSYYGGRGIKVCEQWHHRAGFDQFVDDMGPPNGLTLDRKDGSKDYSPENCRWATWKEQAANRRKVGPVPNLNSLRQKTLKAGLPYTQVYLRIHRMGWSEVKALTEPIRKRGNFSRNFK